MAASGIELIREIALMCGKNRPKSNCPPIENKQLTPAMKQGKPLTFEME